MVNSYLFWTVIINSFLYSMIPWIVKLILSVMFRKEPMKFVNLRQQLSELKSQLIGISMVDEFAKYAKKQRQIRKLNEELATLINARTSSTTRIKASTSTLLHLICGLSAVYLLWYYRYDPIMNVNPNWFYPFNKIMAFPIGTAGTVGITAWLAICSTVAKTVIKSTG